MNMMNNAEMMKRHLGKGDFVELVGADGTVDKIYMPLVCIDDSPDYIVLTTKLSDMKEDSNLMEILNQDDINTIHRILINTLMGSVNGLSEDEMGQFIVANFLPLMTKMFEINKLGSDAMPESSIDKIKAIQARVKNAKNATVA